MIHQILKKGYIVNKNCSIYFNTYPGWDSDAVVTFSESGFDNSGWLYISGTRVSPYNYETYEVLFKFKAKSLEEINKSTHMFFIQGGNTQASYLGMGDYQQITSSVFNTYKEDSNIWNLNTDK